MESVRDAGGGSPFHDRFTEIRPEGVILKDVREMIDDVESKRGDRED